MKLPNWFKIVWWLLLLAIITWFLSERYPELVRGNAVAADVFIFFIWVALALIPLFQEINFFGISLKQEIQKIESELSGIKSEIHSIRVQTNVNVTTPAPPDSELPALAERIQKTVQEEIQKHRLSETSPAPQPIVDPDTRLLLETRYEIEKEIRRVAASKLDLDEKRRPVPFTRLIEMLIQSRQLDARLGHDLREVYAICSAAVHALDPSKEQVEFVRRVSTGLLQVLRSIS